MPRDATMKLAPSLHRVGNDIVAAYLVEDPTGVTVIDAGVSGQWRELLDELQAMGRSIADVRAVLLTHGDTDHIGFAERLRREGDGPGYLPRGAPARPRGGEEAADT